MRPIDADALNEDLRDSYNELRKICDGLTRGEDKAMCGVELCTFLEALMRIKKAPTLDVAPVVHGHFGFVGASAIPVFVDFATCSECKKRIVVREYKNFCPNCGAKMDGDGNDV